MIRNARCRAIGTVAMAMSMGLVSSAHADVFYSTGFESGIPSGWDAVNYSTPSGCTPASLCGWTGAASNALIGVGSQSGSQYSYAYSTYNAAGYPGMVDAWLFTQAFTFKNGSTASFYTEGSPQAFGERMRVYLVPGTSEATANATSLPALLSINEALTPTGYPSTWTQYTLTVAGLSGLTTGRLGFRYTYPDNSLYGDYVALDTVSIQAAPEPAMPAIMVLGFTALAFGLRRNRKVAAVETALA